MRDGSVGSGGLRVLVLVGVGGHGDPWHALEATGARAADALRAAGAEVEVLRTDQADALPDALSGADVLVVNVSGDPALPPPDSAAIVDAILAHAARGGGVLALHSSTLAFAGDPRWSALIGGRWVPGVSGHPPIGEALVRTAARASVEPELELPADFVLHDERYSDLEVAEGVTALAFHKEGEAEHPLVWVTEATDARAGRVAYDALGHGVESYDSAERRALLVALAGWVAPAASTTA
ncbi:ThuA domain-containing protein [Herbiconiux sp. VKM Ac-1786]|uniref:ThuA domain-containing protein n=1 Tax=Herbiconiux sp. VKM Ac-1786 TaxID=2783824 RepID=UPI00188C3433|nr:ThuA domain-containing protein [Herbiconiux sp. VKM Ac-1786]